jgi:quercetin dioxygenase-like cupin family protein
MTDALAVRGDEGEARWWLGALAIIKATAADTGGSLTVLDVTDPPGVKAPMHVHHREDEAFWVLEGEVAFEVGGQTIEASAGDFVFGPRDIPHRYEVGEAGSRMLFPSPPAASRIWSERRAIPPPPAPSRQQTIRCPTRSR